MKLPDLIIRMKNIFLIGTFLLLTISCFSQRVIISLNGVWKIAETMDSSAIPVIFSHLADVPGLVRNSEPAFKGVDQFVSADYNFYWDNPDRLKLTILDNEIGISLQNRNYFWYKRFFNIEARKEIVILKVNKAQFGSSVWINGKFAGRNLSGCTSAFYNITNLVKYNGENDIVIRIGAHPGVLPIWMFSGKDSDKRYWTPGIWDDVSIISCNNPYIESVQVAPDINQSEITVQTSIISFQNQNTFDLAYDVKEWKTGKSIGSPEKKNIKLSPDGRATITEKIPVPDQHLWSPSDPFLYTLEVKTPGDNAKVRFGMRELRFDTKTRKAYLNNRIFYLRGSNIALHRFFDDSLCRKQPWDPRWVKRLLADIPKEFNWNMLRTHVGLVPDFWLDIADENGIMIQYEMQNWGIQPYWSMNAFQKVTEGWMSDCWNHPSVVIWDICNETKGEETGQVIKAVRNLDLSGRPWDDGYNLPDGENDPIEDHHYLHFLEPWGIARWKMKFYEQTVAQNSTNAPYPSGHATILNEYGWFFTRRDGSAGTASGKMLDTLCRGCTNRQIREFSAYMYGGETEYFRAHRNYCGILHFVYLTGDYANSATGDIFEDVENLKVDPAFEWYLQEAFKPLGVYLNFWQQSLKSGQDYQFAVMMVNDEYEPNKGTLKILIEDESNKAVMLTNCTYEVADLSQKTFPFDLKFPDKPGIYKLKAVAEQAGNKKTTTSTRILKIQ